MCSDLPVKPEGMISTPHWNRLPVHGGMPIWVIGLSNKDDRILLRSHLKTQVMR